MATLKLNNQNDSSKRTASQVKAITKQKFENAKVYNTGDGRMFEIEVENSILNRMKLKQLGFILEGTTTSSIYFKAF
jgi:zona occludens toxin (predicted ATPase)